MSVPERTDDGDRALRIAVGGTGLRSRAARCDEAEHASERENGKTRHGPPPLLFARLPRHCFA
jgi:hypothetical protein